ncbi:MAG TPA: hypothetical protein VHO67_01560 [Polyangia bacterium]|nr:hypothetical protein [Polyangia bacterium]
MKTCRGAFWSGAMAVSCALLLGACGSSGGSGGTGGNQGSGTGGSATGGSGTGGTTAGTGGATTATGGQVGSGGTGGSETGTGGVTSTGGSGAAGRGGPAGSGGQAGRGNGQTGGAGGAATGTGGSGGAAVAGNCVGKAWPTADPTKAGPFAVTTEKNVGPLAGAVPDPVYGNTQQRFNVYRPTDMATSGYCHPILVWNNGHTDNPEPNPPQCVTGGGQYCGSYLMVMQQMASHGFVVIASLSTITSQGNPLPNIVGLDWIIQQSQDPTSPYYQHLDTTHIGAFGHSEGGLSTCKEASDPRITAISTVSGTSSLAGLHGPALLFCGGKDTVVPCSGVESTYASITNQPAMFVDNLASDHGGWLYQNGAKGPDIFGMTAWFRVHLMNDTANRKYFYGSDCTLCTDSRVTVMRNALLTQ